MLSSPLSFVRCLLSPDLSRIFCLCMTRYKEGMLKARVDDRETINLIEGAAAGMVATVDAHGHDAVQDWEVDHIRLSTASLVETT